MQRFPDNRHEKPRIIFSFNKLQYYHLFPSEKNVKQLAVTREM